MKPLDYSAAAFPVDDVFMFNDRLAFASRRLGMSRQSLGQVFGHDLWLIKPPVLEGPRLLFAAGFHGEEPAGVWGILHFLENVDPALLKGAAVSFLPLVNPSGIAARRRYNDAGENPNNSFCHTNPDERPSQEGQLLVANLQLLLELAQTSFVSLHEDCDCTEFYVYTFEATKGAFSQKLIDIESRFFTAIADSAIPDQPLKDGLIYNFCDGSFEDRMHHEGVPHTACTETPGKLPLALRVAANSAIVEGVINHFAAARES